MHSSKSILFKGQIFENMFQYDVCKKYNDNRLCCMRVCITDYDMHIHLYVPLNVPFYAYVYAYVHLCVMIYMFARR